MDQQTSSGKFANWLSRNQLLQSTWRLKIQQTICFEPQADSVKHIQCLIKKLNLATGKEAKQTGHWINKRVLANSETGYAGISCFKAHGDPKSMTQ
ncbi:hypothetical protein SLA2020_313300 [Shorea laevis]